MSYVWGGWNRLGILASRRCKTLSHLGRCIVRCCLWNVPIYILFQPYDRDL